MVFTVGFVFFNDVCFVFVLLLRGISSAATFQHSLSLLTGEQAIETGALGKMVGLVPLKKVLLFRKRKPKTSISSKPALTKCY